MDLAVLPAPLEHVSVKVELALSGPTVAVPLAALLPVQPPEATQPSLSELQVNVTEPPEVTLLTLLDKFMFSKLTPNMP